MIKINNDELKIKGTNGELLLEFACIYNAFISEHPEIVAAATIHFGDKLENSGFNPTITDCACAFLSDIDEKGVFE